MEDKKNNRGVGRTALLVGVVAVGLYALTIALSF
jgi:hypothetical protein